MIIDLEWDDAAYLLAVLKKNPGSPSMDRKIRAELIMRMTHYDGYTTNRMSRDIRRRVDYWYAKLMKRQER